MADSQSDSSIFTMRIVSIDYYMAPPIPGIDICYSSFQGGKVNEVPVIRIYGSTPAGQKTCLHVHRALPYLYVPCADISLQPNQEVEACTQVLSLAIEKALKLKGSSGSKRQHVHDCSLVRARKFYGYYSSEELFVKTYLYYPQDVSRAAHLLLGGAVLDKVLQPHESHIPFLLQFLVDYNLYGMGHIHLLNMKFRPPVPDTISKKADYNAQLGQAVDNFTCMADFQADSSADKCSNPWAWTSSTIPAGWLWQNSGEFSASDQDSQLVKRLSTCELEGDATVDDILNQHFKMYSSLSQTCSEVKMVQSLIPIWEEEYERTGMHGAICPDPSKPLPEDVLKILSNGLEFEGKLMGLCNQAENSMHLSASEKDEKFLQLMATWSNEGSLAENVASVNKNGEPLKFLNVGEALVSPSEDSCATEGEGKTLSPELFFVHQTQTSGLAETSDPKAPDKEAMGLLKWLASSQAAEDINSDDDLVHETILSPLLPATTIDKVLEKANVDYESESQQECQDILDSIEDCIDFEDRNEKGSCSTTVKHSPQTSPEKMIPQVDGSGDDQRENPCAGSTSAVVGMSDGKELQDNGKSFTGKQGRSKALWGSLPFPMSRMNDDLQTFSFEVTDNCHNETECSKGTSGSAGNRDDSCSDALVNNPASEVTETGILVGCSVRDLMRRKRSYKAEPSESGTHRMKKVCLGDQVTADTFLRPRRLVFHSTENDGSDMKSPQTQNTRPSLIQRREYDSCDDVVYRKLPLLVKSNNSLQAYALEDKHCESSRRLDGEVGTGFSVGPGNLTSSCPLQVRMDKERSLRNLQKQDSAVSVDHFEHFHSKESNCGIISMKPVNCDGCTCESDPLLDSQLPETDRDGELSVVETFQQMNAAGLGNSSTCSAGQNLSSKFGHICRNDKSRTSLECISERSHESPLRMGPVTNTNSWQFENFGGGAGNGVGLTRPGRSTSMVLNKKDEPIELIGMTLTKKPPVLDWGDVCSESDNTLLSPLIHYFPILENEDNNKDKSVKADEYLPFFLGGSTEEMEIHNEAIGYDNSNFDQEAVMGVPIHYQNDGSYLYMLTPAYSAPSVDSVYRWLLRGERGMSRENASSASVDYSSLEGCLADDPDKPLPEYGLVPDVKLMLDQLDKQNNAKPKTVLNLGHKELTASLQNGNEIVEVKACSTCSQGISQISGPDGKSTPTPRSQIGFRDSASVGGGQQLTLLSVEILTESRGDLRPDPRYDAINVIALAVEDDSDSIPVIYVLLRSTEPYKRNLDGISGCKVLVLSGEKQLLNHFMEIICWFDPDILLGWDIQGGSLGFLAERASYLGISLLKKISRIISGAKIAARDSKIPEKQIPENVFPESVIADPVIHGDPIIEDEWGRTHASGVHVDGRIVLNIWRLMRGEVKLNIYTVEAVAEAVLRRKIPSFPYKVLTKWFFSGPGQARYRCLEYVIERTKLNLEILNQLDMINRTSELARVFGIDFFSVLSRGSQYRVESMLLRLAHTQNYLAISPGSQQVASQPAMECLPLVMEPESGFYADPVVVLDFQSLYPSMIIAYNLCFCTCLGKVTPTKANTLGVCSFSPDPQILSDLKNQILLTPNGVMYVPSKVRKGILPRLLEEILSTRIMVKQAMKKLSPSKKVLQRIFNARQLALKLIANVTYGYTAAGFSGRMPCAELADSIVQCGRRTLEKAISFVNAHDEWKAKVVYGDTDSLFVLLKGRTVEESFRIGYEIASEITAMNPNPVALKLEKVYRSCFLLTKKRYVGYSYESPDQIEPIFDAKGIETIRRDTCGAVSKTMEQSLRLFFERKDINEVKTYLQRQWTRILSGRVSLQDFIFAKEVRLGTYSTRASSSLPPAAIVATKAMKADPRAEPRYAERVPYVVIHAEPGARLVDMVVDPMDLLAVDSPFRLNDLYYINKQIIPALQRVFGLVGADLRQWFLGMPRPAREALGKRQYHAPNLQRTRIDYYYLSKHCLLCGALVQASAHFCNRCSEKKAALATAVTGRTSKLERDMQHLAAICRHCGGGDWLVESGVKCTSLACSVFYERRKVQKELQGLVAVATEAGFYPKCMVEWF